MIRRLHRWGFSRLKLRGGFLHSKLGDRVLNRELWVPTREGIARAWLVAMPVTMIPFLPGQSVIACAIGFMVGANLPLCFLLQFLSTPATAVIQLPACYVAGCLVTGRDVGAALARVRASPMSVVSGESVGVLFLGALVLGFAIGIIAYFLTHVLWRKPLPRVRRVVVPPAQREPTGP